MGTGSRKSSEFTGPHFSIICAKSSQLSIMPVGWVEEKSSVDLDHNFTRKGDYYVNLKELHHLKINFYYEHLETNGCIVCFLDKDLHVD